jgi:hypothetical protein
MGDRKKVFVVSIISVILFSSGLVGQTEIFADKKYEKNTTKIIHLGYLQLAAHDLFNMNRDTEIDSENGLLDVSTVLFNPHGGVCNYEDSLNNVTFGSITCALYDDNDIANGGEIRSSENIMISTAGAEVGEKYLHYVNTIGAEKAYDKILEFYYTQLNKAYEESFHLQFPEPEIKEITNLHNLAVRSGHDLLPAKIMYDGCDFPDEQGLCSLFIIDPLGAKLSQKEQRQQSSPVDGTFDNEFLGIKFCPIKDVFCIEVDLLEADQSFGKQFKDKDLDLDKNTFDEFMQELVDGSFDETDRVSMLLDEAFSQRLG